MERRFRKIPEGSGESRARRRFWRVLLAYEQNNAPVCRFESEKANAHDTVMRALLLLGIPPKLILVFIVFNKTCDMGSLAQNSSGAIRCMQMANGVPEGSRPES